MTRAPDFFSANATTYDRSRPSRLSDLARDAIVPAARLPLQGCILDVAAGTGRVAIPLAGAGYRVVAVDRSEEMLRRLRGKAATERVAAVVASGASLPFGNRTFDAVLIARLLYLTPDWQHILIEALRVLAPGGHLLHEWANGTPSEPSVQIKEHLRTLLEEAGVAEPFHLGSEGTGFLHDLPDSTCCHPFHSFFRALLRPPASLLTSTRDPRRRPAVCRVRHD